VQESELLVVLDHAPTLPAGSRARRAPIVG